MSEWQPIETAPKDGSEFSHMGPMILLASPFGHFAVGYWGKGLDRAMGWINPNDHRRMDYWNAFTHWMPLPERPARPE